VVRNYRNLHANVLPVNGGGWAMGGQQESQKMQSLFLLDAMGSMDYAAVNVAPVDLTWGVDALRKEAEAKKVTLVSANLKRKSDGGHPFQPYVIRNVKGLRVAFLGVMQEGEPLAPFGPDADAYEVVPPKDAVAAIVPEIRTKADVVVAFTHLGQRKTQQLVDEVKGIDVALSGMDGFVNHKPTEVGTDSTGGRTLVLEAGERGKYVGALTMVVSEHGKILRFTNEVHSMDKNVKDDSLMALRVTELKKNLADARKREMVQQAVGGPNTETGGEGTPAAPHEKFIGANMCARCHQSAFDSWQASKHAHAMASLEAKAMESSADCLKCHVTGYNTPSGYPAAHELGSVSCEQCHGFGTLHGDTKFIAKPGVESCTVCHDAKNSPKFEYQSYLAKIAHH
jgi:2',3'-cyclic-nucleotide 2'-phosphodiesterase (5'-nucleotidase family)